MKKGLIVWLMCLPLMLAFQNCTEKDFDFVAAEKFNEVIPGIDITPGDNSGPGASDPDTAGPIDDDNMTPPVPVCEPGYTLINGECFQTVFTECQAFVELDRAVIPSLKTTGLCFYKKLGDAVGAHKSGSWGEILADDVIARAHSRGELENAHPYVMADGSVTLTFRDQRKISLTSSATGNQDEIARANLKMDNFILVEVTNNMNSNKNMLARGTADSEPRNGRILVNGDPVTDFIPYADGGTALVPVLDISSKFTLDAETTLRVRMLDCGSSASASDMYLIIH